MFFTITAYTHTHSLSLKSRYNVCGWDCTSHSHRVTHSLTARTQSWRRLAYTSTDKLFIYPHRQLCTVTHVYTLLHAHFIYLKLWAFYCFARTTFLCEEPRLVLDVTRTWRTVDVGDSRRVKTQSDENNLPPQRLSTLRCALRTLSSKQEVAFRTKSVLRYSF